MKSNASVTNAASDISQDKRVESKVHANQTK